MKPDDLTMAEREALLWRCIDSIHTATKTSVNEGELRWHINQAFAILPNRGRAVVEEIE